MNSSDFIKAKGQKVYWVCPYNFNFWSASKAPVNIVNIVELTVESAGKKQAYFQDYTGNARTKVWFDFDGKREFDDIFTSIDEALQYTKSINGPSKPLEIYKRRALISNWAAFSKDIPERLI
jgi:hypothetical protein